MKIDFNCHNHQTFGGALPSVLILMVLGCLLLMGLNQSIFSWKKTAIRQVKYYQQYNLAMSSIEWSITQQWPVPTATWHCQKNSSYQLEACIKLSNIKADNFIIIRGQSHDMTLYHLARFDISGKIEMERGHWLDYCPEKRSLDCD